MYTETVRTVGEISGCARSDAQPDADLGAYKSALLRKGRAIATINKSLRGIHVFFAWLGTRMPSPEIIRQWMTEQEAGGTAISSINEILSALNGFWKFTVRHELMTPLLKVERSQYVQEERMLTEKDFRKLLDAEEVVQKGGVKASKVFPHNLRRLFAVRVYKQTKDLDFVRRRLGHRSADTTSLYIRGSQAGTRDGWTDCGWWSEVG